MKKAFVILATAVISFFCADQATAQKGNLWGFKKWNLEAGLSAGGRSAGSMELVGGLDMRVQRSFSNRIAATFSAGFTRFFDINKDNILYTVPEGIPIHFPGEYENYLNYIPVKGGVKVLVAGNAYVGGEAGYGFNLNGNSSFIWAPAVGMVFPKFDLSVRYEDFMADHDAKQVAARLAWRLR